MAECRGDGLEGIVFDLDGTLVHSEYDWPAIRRQLGVGGPSLIDALNALPPGERERAWRRLEKIEERATGEASVAPGALKMLNFCRSRSLALAIVTNNTAGNTAYLIRKHGLGAFDLVLTRDSGFYKPSGRPLVECARRLGISPACLMMVGDSDYDLRSARSAGYRWRVLVSEDDLVDSGGREFSVADLQQLLSLLEGGRIPQRDSP